MTKQSKSGDRLLLRQIEGENWELWSLGENGKSRLEQACHAPDEAKVSASSVLALPARQLFAIPLWLATTDAALMRDMIFLQLERRGLAGARSAEEAVFDYRVLKSAENKTLVLVVSLPAALPERLCLNLRNYEPSARAQPLPQDEFILWREGDRLALAVTQGPDLVYFQALAEESPTEAVLQEMQCIRLQLEAENVIVRLKGITLWDEFSPREVSAIEEAMDLPVRNATRPAPVMPEQRFELVPNSVRQVQQTRKTEERRKSVIAAVAGVYLLLMLFLVLRVTLFYVQCRGIQAELKNNEALVNELRSTAGRWDSLDAAVNPETYPVELLLRCARLLPAEGVRFTLFKVTGGRIFIQGEAKNAPAAFKFAEDLKRSKELGDYQWQMPQPKLLANDNAEFQIEGARYGEKNN